MGKLIAVDRIKIVDKFRGSLYVTTGKNMKFLFQACDVERYTTSHYTNLLVRMNSCKKNNDVDKAELKKGMTWYMEIRRTIHQAIQMLTA